MENNNWLPHVTSEMTLAARGNNLCSYLIALEGWRRGLTLKWSSEKVKKKGLHAPGRQFSLSNGEKTYVFYKSKGDLVSQKAVGIGKDKELTKEWLSRFGVPVPEGKRFLDNIDDEEIINYAQSLGYPVVLKPTKGDQGIGVIANIQNKEYLKESLTHVRSTLNLKDVIIERYIAGDEFRIFAVEDTVIAAIKRIPANITGDGVSTIKQLIDMKNNERKKNPRLYSCLINIDHEVKSFAKMAGFTLNSIPKKGERVFLRENSNISTGGDSVDVTDELPQEIKEIAIKALKVVPGLPHGGVDIIINKNAPEGKVEGVVIELNPVPQIGSLVFPMIGKARDVPGAIIDFYFPETKNKEVYNPHVYFDFKTLLQPLINKSASEVTVSPAPTGVMVAKRFVVEGNVQGIGYHRWIRKRALETDLYGYVRLAKNGNVVIVVAGSEEAVENFKDICVQWSKGKDLRVIKESAWEKPIMVGFEIKSAKIKGENKKLKETPKDTKEVRSLTLKQKIKLLFS